MKKALMQLALLGAAGGLWGCGPEQALEASEQTGQVQAAMTTCFGRTPTLYCTAGVHCYGSSGGQVIMGSDGDDRINTKVGDIVCGGRGNDLIYGPDPWPNTSAGNTTLSGDDGDDTIYASKYGGDTIYGGPGKDLIYGANSGYGTNYNRQYLTKIYGGAGDDSLRPNRYENTAIDGQTEYDSCYGVVGKPGTTAVNCEFTN